MVPLDKALATLDERQRTALDWFQAHKGMRVAWAEMQTFSEESSRLVNQAKGIYKPAYTDYALSVRTLQDGPYPDKEVEYRSDGSWVCQYFQENPDPSKRDREATNRGLVKCMGDEVPIGFLVKRKPKPGVQYDVLGLGYVVDWSAGYFTIEGIADNGSVHVESDASRSRAAFGAASLEEEDYSPGDDISLRERTISMIAVRRGQASFRANLLEAYDGHCCITGCDLKDALEAAHITPYRGPQSNHPQNGLLLRADIHTLFDLGLMAIETTGHLVLAPALLASRSYCDLSNQRLRVPSDPRLIPCAEALFRHRQWAGL
jgi:putative restriction endonuclease